MYAANIPCLSGTSATLENERVKEYLVESAERTELKTALAALSAGFAEMPLIIGGKRIQTGTLEHAIVPHNHAKLLGHAHLAGRREAAAAIAAAKAVSAEWANTPWAQRAGIFRKAADLVAGPWRARLNAATMLGQSKTVLQAEIDAAAELIDFLRFNAAFADRIYAEQPISIPGVRNTTDYRPLEGFVYAITPFNFTAIACNLATAPAMMGNTVVWKPSPHAKLSAAIVMQILEEAGLPPGVINLVYGDAETISDVCFSDSALAGVNFTGSTAVFASIQARISACKYRNHPRVVGETGGKNFVLAHPSADVDALRTAIIRAGFEYQGQKCSAASRIFVPRSIWPGLRDALMADIETIKMGDVANFSTFMGAVIHEQAWRHQTNIIADARQDIGVHVMTDAAPNAEIGYFVPPTLMEVDSPNSRFMCDEFFGPIVSVYAYDDDRLDDTMTAIDTATVYGLTGAIFTTDRSAIEAMTRQLRYAAGNFYINDKPTGAVVGQQPFGGARASGTNDKAGALWNLLRWVSPRTIKETEIPPHDYRYPYMSDF